MWFFRQFIIWFPIGVVLWLLFMWLTRWAYYLLATAY